MKKVYFLLADGFEETEAITPWDILKRAGATVVTVSVTGKREVIGSHGLTVMSDMLVNDCGDFDMVVLPGGMPGSNTLKESPSVKELLRKASKEKKFIAAICAAPMVLGKYGLLDGKKCTCFPGFEEKLGDDAITVHEKCVIDGNIVTACGMGSSQEFGYALSEVLFGKEKSDTLKTQTTFIF